MCNAGFEEPVSCARGRGALSEASRSTLSTDCASANVAVSGSSSHFSIAMTSQLLRSPTLWGAVRRGKRRGLTTSESGASQPRVQRQADGDFVR